MYEDDGFTSDIHLEGRIRVLDVATPLTMKRYTNATRGAYMSFSFTKSNMMYANSGVIRGLKNFYLAGQWMASPGGLPFALATGSYAIQEICRKEKIKYIFAFSSLQKQN